MVPKNFLRMILPVTPTFLSMKPAALKTKKTKIKFKNTPRIIFMFWYSSLSEIRVVIEPSPSFSVKASGTIGYD